MSIENRKKYFIALIAKEISTFSRYYHQIFQVNLFDHDQEEILEFIDCPEKQIVHQIEEIPLLTKQKDPTLILLNGTLNHHLNIQGLLTKIKSKLSRSSRVVLVMYNPYFRWLYTLATFLEIREGPMPSTFVTNTDLKNIAKLAEFEVVRIRPSAYVPFQFFGLGSIVNYILPAIPLLRWLSFVNIIILKPIIPEKKKPSLTIVIPARNEKGNIENALKRIPDFGTKNVEIIFVEGHSTDKTWQEIQRVLPLYKSQFKLKAFQQTGKGKNDAVRLGFSHATGEILTILDADLTMPPELLVTFYEGYCRGLADFINGNRLVYPMEGEAMRFLNHLGNIFFAKALSNVLDTKLGDSLCGTKLVSRKNYERFVAWREDFGDFDPFGDFELLFPAAILGLGIIDIPTHYKARTYGSTNINRFEHGRMLLKMTAIGLKHIKTGNT